MSFRIVAVLGVLMLAGCNRTADQRTTSPLMPSPPTAPVNISGAYIMTLTASDRCTSLPDTVRTSTYDATISQDAPLTSGSLTMAGVGLFGFPGVVLSVSGNVVSIDFSGYGDGFYEPVMTGGALIVWGVGRVVADGSTMAGTLSGTINYSVDAEHFSHPIECNGDHLLVFRRK